MTGDVRERRDVGVMASPTMPIAAAHARCGDSHEHSVGRAGRCRNVDNARRGQVLLSTHSTPRAIDPRAVRLVGNEGCIIEPEG